MTRPDRVLVVGKDGRTDAIAAACVASSRPIKLYGCCEFHSPGLLSKCDQVMVVKSLTDTDAIIKCARDVKPDLAIIGPEEPLGAGLVDALEDMGVRCFGPRKSLARLETSKAWTRKLLAKYKIPGNLQYRVFHTRDGMRDFLDQIKTFVVKPDGLTGGKGVRVHGEHLESIDAGVAYAAELLERDGRVVIEKKLVGEEFSIQSITDGRSLVHCPAVQDHKRAYEGDRGPNTGGMGSYSCSDFSLPFLSKDDIDTAQQINEAVANALLAETGTAYRGVLYGGFMATRDGVRLIEYNARFADPESLNVLPLLDGDFLDICEAVTTERLGELRVGFHPKATVCKYVVPSGYPAKPERGSEIRIPREITGHPDIRTYYAAVNLENDRILLTGSRAVAFVGIADDLQQAEELAERAAASVSGEVRHRRDIGTSEVVLERVQNMRNICDNEEAAKTRTSEPSVKEASGTRNFGAARSYRGV